MEFRNTRFIRRALGAACWAATLVIPWAPLQADAKSDGLAALDRGDYARARELFSAAVAADSNDYSALFNLAFAESQLHQDDAATGHLKQVLALKPNLYEAELNLGMLYLRDGKAAQGLPLLQDAVHQRPNAPRAQQYVGEALRQTGDQEHAVEAFAAAAKLDPKAASIQLKWGQSLAASGKLDDAAPHYQAAVALDGGLRSYLAELAQDYEKVNRNAEAIALLQQVPPEPAIQEELGRLLLASGKAEAAAEQFRAAVNTAPTAANKLALASALLQTAHPEAAEPFLAEALQSNPNDYEVLIAIGKIEQSKRNFKLAAELFVKAATVKADSAEAWSNAASSLILSEQYPQALAALDRIHALGADKPGDIYFRAVVYDKLRQLKPALASYQQFLQVSHGQFPDQEFIARHRSAALEKEIHR